MAEPSTRETFPDPRWSPEQCRAVFFDAAGTLLHLPKGVGWHYRDVAARHGLMLNEPQLNTAFRAAWKSTPPPLNSRAARPDDDRGWWEALVWQVLDECGADPAFDRAAYFDELYREFTLPGVWAAYPEAEAVLTTLQGRYKLGVISNFDGRLRVVLRHLGLDRHFSWIVLSSEVGANKPDPWIFTRALEMAGMAPHQALHIGDDPQGDWEGAADAGLGSFKLQRPENSLRDVLPLLGVVGVRSA